MPRHNFGLIHELAPQPRLELDWQRYFMDFCHLHGDNPIIEGGRLLFQDGWTHSISDYGGPEWPPPNDREELKRLKRIYWTARKDMVDAELVRLERTMIGIDQMKRVRSARIKTRVQIPGEFEGRPPNMVAPIDLVDDEAEKHIRTRIEFLRNDVEECETKLKDLSSLKEPANA